MPKIHYRYIRQCLQKIKWFQKSNQLIKIRKKKNIWETTICFITSIGNLINIIQVDLFGAKVIISCSNGIVKLSIASILWEYHRKITILFMALEKLL